MSGSRALICVGVMWLGAQLAEFSLNQWLTQHSDGALATVKPILAYVILHAAGEFGVGFWAGVIIMSVINWPLAAKLFKKCKAFFFKPAREPSTNSPPAPALYHFGGMGGGAPGAGGGGGSAQGPYAAAGSGGGGGDIITSMLPDEVLAEMKTGTLKAEVVVGKGGRPDPAGIRKGEAGGDTWIRFTDVNGGEIFKSTASGGKGGESGKTGAKGGVGISMRDLSAGFRSSTAMLAEVVHYKNGLLYLMGGGIDLYIVESFPATIELVMLNVFSVPFFGDCFPRVVDVAIVSPGGDVTPLASILVLSDKHNFIITNSDIRMLSFVAQSSGRWIVRVTSGEFELARLPLLIRTAEHT